MFKCKRNKQDMEIEECIRRQNRRIVRVIGDISPSYLECKGCDQGRANLGLCKHPKRQSLLFVCGLCLEEKEENDFETIGGKRNSYCKECAELLRLEDEYKQRRKEMGIELEIKEEAKVLIRKGHSTNYIAKKLKVGIGNVRLIREDLYSEIRKQGYDLPKCGCGKDSAHKGRCEFRRKEENIVTKSDIMENKPKEILAELPQDHLHGDLVENIIAGLMYKFIEIESLCITIRTLKEYGAKIEKTKLENVLRASDSIRSKLANL